MPVSIMIDWRFILALGVIALGIVYIHKLDSSQLTEVSLHGIDAYVETHVSKDNVVS